MLWLSLDGDVVGLVVGRRIPHRELTDEPGEQRAQGGIAVDALDGDLDGASRTSSGKPFGPGQHLARRARCDARPCG